MARPTICLNMIVKDESAVIQRCLENLRPFIDTWVICDTGSTDGTQDIIRKAMDGLPGELHERPWKNFGFNRTESINLAEGKADYILTLDADEFLNCRDNFSWGDLSADVYTLEKQRGDRVYRVPNLVRSGHNWRWEGVLHEYINCDAMGDLRFEEVHGLRVISPREGTRSNDPHTYRRDAIILEQGLIDEPENVRYMFYLAQSYRDSGDFENAERWYRTRIEKGGWHEEIYMSLLNIARLKIAMKRTRGEVMDAYLIAYEHTPDRAETMYDLGMLFAREKRWQSAWLFLEKAAKTPHNPAHILFIEEEVYEWRARMEAGVAAFWAGNYKASAALSEALLGSDLLPSRMRGQVTENLRYAVEKLSTNS